MQRYHKYKSKIKHKMMYLSTTQTSLQADCKNTISEISFVGQIALEEFLSPEEIDWDFHQTLWDWYPQCDFKSQFWDFNEGMCFYNLKPLWHVCSHSRKSKRHFILWSISKCPLVKISSFQAEKPSNHATVISIVGR